VSKFSLSAGKTQFWLVLMVAGCLTGCAGDGATPEGEGAQANPSSSSVSADQVAGGIEEKIQGVWYGQATLNEALIEERLKNLTPQRQEDLILRAQSFLSTVMAIEFRPDGGMENEIGISPPGGQLIRETRKGTWQIVEKNGNQFVVETTEKLPTGESEVSQRLYEISDDGNQIALMVPLNDELGQCEPFILMSRFLLNDENLAQSPSDTLVK
jgi:hypothetical protein